MAAIGALGGAIGALSGDSSDSERTIAESAETVDRAGYTLSRGFVHDVLEITQATDRSFYDLIPTFAQTIHESAEATDRTFYDFVEPITYVIREEAEAVDRAFGGSQALYGPQMIILTHIYDYFEGSDPWSFSGGTVVNSHNHLGKVLTWGSSTREIPIPAGPPRLGQLELEFDDTPDPITGVQYFRANFGARTPKGKRVDLLIGPSTGSEALFQIPAAGTIEHAVFPPNKMILRINDVRYKWLQKLLPLLINRTNFANLPADMTEAFAPFIFGEISGTASVASPPDFSSQGAIRLIHVDTVQHRYCVACHIVDSVTVFKRATGEEEFSEVVSGYSLVFEDFDIGGLTYTFSFVQFDADQAGAEIRADVAGWPFGGAWGTVPFLTGVQTNVIEHAITFLYYVDALHKGFLRDHALALADFDLNSFATVKQQIEDLGYLSAYAITEQTTPEVVLTQLFSTFLIHWFPNRLDKTKVVRITDDTPTTAPIFGDFHSILRETDTSELAVDTRNKINYRFSRDYASGGDSWFGQDVFDNTADQSQLTDSDGEIIIEPEDVDFHACRDEDTALALAAEWAAWRDQDAQRVRFELHMPTNLTKVDLAKDFLLTLSQGLKSGGWSRERFFPYKVTDQYDALRFTVEAIRIVSPTLPENAIVDIGQWAWNALVGPWYYSGTRTVFTAFGDNRANMKKLVVLKNGTEVVDDGVFPALTDQIGSFEYRRSEGKIHAATQEFNTGRVAYHVFDLATETWEILNQEVVTSTTHGDYGVSICIRQPSGNPLIMYQGDRDTTDGSLGQFGAGEWRRLKCKTLVDGVWGAEIAIRDEASEYATNPWFAIWGDPNYYGSLHFNVGRAIAEENDCVRFVFAREEPADVASTQDLQTQILTGADTLSNCFEFQWTSALGYSAFYAFGDPCTFEHDGIFYTAVPVGLLKFQKLCIWQSTTIAGAPDFDISLSTAETMPDTFGTVNPPMTVRWFKNKLYVVIGTRVAGTDEWAVVKTLEPPSFVPSPSTARDDQAGPTWPESVYGRHGAELATVRGVDYLLKVTSGTFGVQSTSGTHIFEKIRLSTLPTDNSYTIDDFIADYS